MSIIDVFRHYIYYGHREADLQSSVNFSWHLSSAQIGSGQVCQNPDIKGSQRLIFSHLRSEMIPCSSPRLRAGEGIFLPFPPPSPSSAASLSLLPISTSLLPRPGLYWMCGFPFYGAHHPITAAVSFVPAIFSVRK